MQGLIASDIFVRFGGLVALNDVSVEAPRNRITGLIGPNGAGKTTLFNVCCGFLRPQRGHVTLDGADTTHFSPAHRARLGMGRTFQRMELFSSLTVRDNVALAVEARHVRDDPMTQLGLLGGGRRVRRQVLSIADDLIEETGLGPVANRLAGEISTWQGRLVELARALARDPHMLLLDEPSSGLDAAESAAFGRLLVRIIGERDIGMLMVEHDMSLVLSICEWIHVLDFGRMLFVGTPDEVRQSDDVRAAYLGREGVEAS
jgi:ABC-type branched-subunit amino acid transport system ATPase component